jgi:hypothetical protein
MKWIVVMDRAELLWDEDIWCLIFMCRCNFCLNISLFFPIDPSSVESSFHLYKHMLQNRTHIAALHAKGKCKWQWLILQFCYKLKLKGFLWIWQKRNCFYDTEALVKVYTLFSYCTLSSLTVGVGNITNKGRSRKYGTYYLPTVCGVYWIQFSY